MTLKTPCAWLRELEPEVMILDPDGWRMPGSPPWEEPISKAEFQERFARCTIGPRHAGWDDHLCPEDRIPHRPRHFTGPHPTEQGQAHIRFPDFPRYLITGQVRRFPHMLLPLGEVPATLRIDGPPCDRCQVPLRNYDAWVRGRDNRWYHYGCYNPREHDRPMEERETLTMPQTADSLSTDPLPGWTEGAFEREREELYAMRRGLTSLRKRLPVPFRRNSREHEIDELAKEAHALLDMVDAKFRKMQELGLGKPPRG